MGGPAFYNWDGWRRKDEEVFFDFFKKIKDNAKKPILIGRKNEQNKLNVLSWNW